MSGNQGPPDGGQGGPPDGGQGGPPDWAEGRGPPPDTAVRRNNDGEVEVADKIEQLESQIDFSNLSPFEEWVARSILTLREESEP